MTQLYPSHIPTTWLQKGLLAIGSAAIAITNPKRGDMVATMGETTALRFVLENIKRRMENDQCGARLLNERLRVTNSSVNLARLRALPEGTFGKEYSRFMDRLETTPDERPKVQFVDDANLVYIMQRYRETHDFNHVLLQMKTNMLGEVTVKLFEGLQLGLPMCVLGAIFGGLRLGPKHRKAFVEKYLPWCTEQAVNGRFLIAFDWENHFEKPLTEVQNMCSIEPFQTYQAS